MYPESKRVLLSERADGKGWNLPGGRVEDGEDDLEALVREVKEETGLDVEVIGPVGEPLVFNDDTAVAYSCRVVGGQLTATNEAKAHRACTAGELQQGFFRVAIKDWGEHCDVAMTCGYQDIPLKLVGPTDKLGRTARMVYDALSLMEEPTVGTNEGTPEEDDVFVSPDGCYLVNESHEGRKSYRRIDPFGLEGFVAPRT